MTQWLPVTFEIVPWPILCRIVFAAFQGIAISLVVLGANLLGDALRDILDPQLRN